MIFQKLYSFAISFHVIPPLRQYTPHAVWRSFFLQSLAPAQEEDLGSQSGLPHHRKNTPKKRWWPSHQLTGKVLLLVYKVGQVKISEVYLLSGKLRKTEAMFSATDAPKTF